MENYVVMIDPERIQRLVERVNSTSNAEFVKRLLDERRRILRNTDGTVSTHELAYVTDDNGNAVVYPEVQSSMYGLMRYPSVNAYERAVERGDTLQMSAPDAELFTRNYKDYYPGFDSYACGGKKYPGGGKFFRTDLQRESPMMYQPMPPMYHELVPPMRFRPEPDNGDYVPPVSTGMVQGMPIGRTYLPVVPETGVLMDEMERPSVIDLFSDEAKARRALKQRYAESAFDDRAVSKAGAQGAWQIMPITLKDYLGRGKGKTGDLNDPEYNRKVRDWVMGIIPRDLKEFWSDSDSDRAKLAKLYAAYNWGAGNLRSFLRKKRDAGVDIGNPDNWVDDLNPETRRYVKYLAFDEDIPDSIYTNSAFEDAARKRGYMAEGGRLFKDGGDKKRKRLAKLIARFAEKNTNGLINADDVNTILEHPTDYMKHLYSDNELNEMRNRLYAEYYPMGYFNREGIPAASDIMQGKESKGEAEMLRNTMRGAILHNNAGSERMRDAYFAQWLGIPEEDRRYPGVLVPAPYVPSVGSLDDYPVFSISGEFFPNKDDQIVDTYLAAKQLSGNEFTPAYLMPKKGKGDNYVVDSYTFLMKNDVPETKDGWKKWEKNNGVLYNNAKSPDLFANGLAAFTVGSGVDPQRGQYISMFDKWDINPFDENGTYGGGLMAKISKAAGIPQNFDATGGVGNPFYIYDRVYLDDYYGVNSRPQNPDEFYGGYIMPTTITANKEASGGKIRIKPENRGKFTALKKRTGHSASWFKAHGTPAQKKMAVFALNSRHWRHDSGGLLHTYNEGYQLGQVYDLSEEQVNELIRQGYEVERI